MEFTKPILIKDLGSQYPTATSKQRARFGLYKCQCGKEFKTIVYSVNNGHTSSCGCLSKEKRRLGTIKHGMTNTRLYGIFKGMKRRCYTKRSELYLAYGGRGITICDEWLNDKKKFFKWALENGYKDTLSIDRVDNDGNYEPTNCRWTTQTVQSSNTRRLRNTNKSGYRGVSFRKDTKKWAVYITVNNKRISLGCYTCRIQGAYAYDKYVKENNLEHTTNF